MLIVIGVIVGPVNAQLSPETRRDLSALEILRIRNQPVQALKLIKQSILKKGNSADDMTYLYANQSMIYGALDSLLLSKKYADLGLEYSRKAQSRESKAIAYRAEASLYRQLNLPDEVVKSALNGLQFLENSSSDLLTQYGLNYLLYGVYSRWNDESKMNYYIRQCEKIALMDNNYNSLVNVNNGISSMFQAAYEGTRQKSLLDSSFHYLQKSFALHEKSPEKISPNSFVITCVNFANYYLQFSKERLEERKRQAFRYLSLAEQELEHHNAAPDYWVNIYGIKSSFAEEEKNLLLAEQYLLQCISQIQQDDRTFYKSEYTVYKHLADIAVKKNELNAALNYQQIAEKLLKKTFDQQQIFNTQRLEIQYETEKKNQQLSLLSQRADFRKKQNYLYGGIALALLTGLVFMFRSYHFKLRFAIEREKMLEQEKEESENRANMQLKLEKEEQARLKAEQELLELKRKQLEKEALANSLIIEHKTDMLQQIQSQLKDGNAGNIKKLLKEEMLLHADFEDIKSQIQQLHPGFFNQLSEKSLQKLTPLDVKYCAYLHLQMTTKQIAQALHIAPQSVRMFKYRLKQKFGLDRDTNLEEFLQTLF
ncbi:hypothetical protein ABDK00_010065 [Niabella insulamsoli]|uniref:hypothetical protein n=1 Tax=Niabella insulamsoli TaxID=3144874 RepID=UPI0031FBBD7F